MEDNQRNEDFNGDNHSNKQSTTQKKDNDEILMEDNHRHEDFNGGQPQ